MLERLTSTTFSSGANDKIATIDAYKIANSSITNINPNVEDMFSLNSLSGLKSTDLTNSSAATDKIVSSCKKDYGLTVDSDSLLKGVVGSNTDLLSSLKGLSPDLQSKLLSVKNPLPSSIGSL